MMIDLLRLHQDIINCSYQCVIKRIDRWMDGWIDGLPVG